VLDAADQGAEYALGALEGETNPDHDFSVMDEQALIDLALFIAEETMDYDQFVSEDKMAAGGDLAVGAELFVSECGGCHGLQGTALNFGDVSDPEYIAGLALGNPWEFAHKMRFGQPDQPGMTSAVDIGWTLDEQLAVLAFAQSLPTSSPVEGGLLYDKWWKALGADEPDGEQALWASQSTNEREGSDTWRCKECHGWDYRGSDGAYGSGSHYTGFVGVQDAGSMSAEDLAAWLVGATNPDHDFSGYLEGPQIDMLAAFLQGAPDTSEFINADKTVNGDPDNGKALYDAGCALCHGDDGQQINFGGADEPEYVGTLASGNPWEVFHKVSYGNPGSPMPSGVSLGWSFQDIADVVAYAQTLPAE
jgi:thiosulfate dehydrogenase